MEKRAVRVSFELWKQMATEGYASGGLRCVQGLPKDAEFLGSFCETETLAPDGKGGYRVRTEPVFVFGSDNWDRPVSADRIVAIAFGEILPSVAVVFRTAECRTCKWWEKREKPPNMENVLDMGWCELTRESNLRASKALVVHSKEEAVMATDIDFGCTQYEPRETND